MGGAICPILGTSGGTDGHLRAREDKEQFHPFNFFFFTNYHQKIVETDVIISFARAALVAHSFYIWNYGPVPVPLPVRVTQLRHERRCAASRVAKWWTL